MGDSESAKDQSNSRAPGQVIRVAGWRLRLLRLLGKGKSGYSWLALAEKDGAATAESEEVAKRNPLVEENAPRQCVVKLMHDEPCPYYQFGDKFAAEIRAHEILSGLGVPIPRLLAADGAARLLVKEFIDGPVAAEAIARGGVPEKALGDLFRMARHCAQGGWNLDYFPTNFVLQDGELFYIDYEVNPFDAAWSLENWGIYYWANFEGMRRFLDTGDASAINSDPERGLPRRDGPIGVRAAAWIAKYGARD